MEKSNVFRRVQVLSTESRRRRRYGWAAISATAKTDLIFNDGNLNGQRYIDEVLAPHVLLLLRQMPVAHPIFQDDNARPHRARIVDNNVNRVDWPTMSPDLCCIEPVWYVLGRAVHARQQGKQHATKPLAVPKRRMGPNSTTDDQQTSVPIKEQSPLVSTE